MSPPGHGYSICQAGLTCHRLTDSAKMRQQEGSAVTSSEGDSHLFRKRQVWLFRTERVLAWSGCQNQHLGAKWGCGWVVVGRGRVGCELMPTFLTKSFLRSADLSEGRWFQEPQRRRRPPARVRAAVCSQQYLISPRGKSGRLDLGVWGGGTWLEQQ